MENVNKIYRIKCRKEGCSKFAIRCRGDQEVIIIKKEIGVLASSAQGQELHKPEPARARAGRGLAPILNAVLAARAFSDVEVLLCWLLHLMPYGVSTEYS